MEDPVRASIVNERALTQSRLRELEAEVMLLRQRLAQLDRAEAALSGQTTSEAKRTKDASKAAGGRARAQSMPPERRAEIARAAAAARWGKRPAAEE